MRKKTLITSLMLAGIISFPVTSLALGLGRLSVQSGLGQPLSAQIELSSAQKEELDSLRARVAEPSVYRENNAQYVGALARARVTVEQGPNNVPYLRVSTPQAINEPYLDLIVEVNWATGRLVRNYTFLLDPPGALDAQAVEPAPIARAQTSTFVTPPARGQRAAQSGAPAAQPARQQAQAGDAGTGAGARAGENADTYQVKRGDTLSKIAGEYKPANASLEQMLVALFRSNESAFEGGNMNRLRSGQILNMPAADQVAAVPPTEASQVVRVQASDWRSYRDRVAGAAPLSSGEAPRQASAGRIGTTVEEKTPAVQPGRDKLSVSRETGKGGTTAAQAEEAASRDKALRDANARVAELEKTVRDLQRANELKNQTMSELQARAEAGKGKVAEPAKAEPMKVEPRAPTPAPAAVAPTVPVPAARPATPAPAAATPAPAPVATPPAPTPPAVVATAPAAKAPETKAPAPAPAPTPAPAAKVEPKQEPKAPAPAATATPAKKGTETSFIDDLFGNTPTWLIGGGALVVLAGIAGIIAARRRKTTKFEDSIISGTDIKTNTVFGSTGGGVVNTGDNSLASDFSREGLGNIDTDEVDPIAEAEVYLAYGRDAQAEEILKDALKKDAQRQEIYFKLLEIHAQHNKPSAFETVASELYSVAGGKGEVWHKAMALGRQLDPSNPMYAEAGGDSAFTAPAVAAKAADTAHAAETQVFSVPPELKPEPQHTSTPLDFTLDDDISLSPTSAEAAPVAKSPAAILAGAAHEVAKSTKQASEPAKEKLAGAAAALAGGAAALAGAATAAKPAAEKAPSKMLEPVSFEPESIPKFDLDFKLDGPSSVAPAMAPPSFGNAMPFPEPEPVLISSPAPAPQLSRPAAAIELDKLDLAFDPQRSTFEDPTPSVLDGQWHDAATKLDLAKAYQEMGDVEGAREILQEVLHEGDDQQKAEARTLLTKLA